LKNGDFSYTLSTEEIRDQYGRMSSSLLAFVKDRVEVDPQGWISKECFYLEYVKYCNEYKLPAKNKSVVGRELPMHITVIDEKQTTERGRKMGLKGIKIVLDVQDVLDISHCNRKENNKVKYRKKADIVDIVDRKKEEKVNKIGLWAINYLKNNRNVPKNFFVNDILKEFPNADKKQLEDFYDQFKQNEAEGLT
jgi:hypothetical protein